MLSEAMHFHTETKPGANFGNFNGQNDEVTLRCVCVCVCVSVQDTLLYMYNILSAIIDLNWLGTFRYGHLSLVPEPGEGRLRRRLYVPNREPNVLS